jgi:hypothetical protein
MEPTGRANARPMTGSAQSGIGSHADEAIPDYASIHPGYRTGQGKSPAEISAGLSIKTRGLRAKRSDQLQTSTRR